VNFRWTPLAAAQRIRNLIFGCVGAEAGGNKNSKMEKKPRQKCHQEFSSEEKVSLIQAVEERPVLWDLTHKKHFDAVFMKRTWEEIALVIDKDCKL